MADPRTAFQPSLEAGPPLLISETTPLLPKNDEAMLFLVDPRYGCIQNYSYQLYAPRDPLPDDGHALGRHLGFWSTTNLITGRILGTGIFSTPSNILANLGSPGASLLMWLFGLLFSYAGQSVYIELASIMPCSGGEKIYMERVYPRPFITYIFACHAVLLGFTAAGCIVFAENTYVSLNHHATTFESRSLAVGLIVFVTLIHGLLPKVGVRLMNAFAFVKIGILLAIVLSGIAVLLGMTQIEDPFASFRRPFADTTISPYFLAMAAFKVTNSFVGWSNAGYVLSEVKDPVPTIKKAGPLGLTICGLLYLAANIAYFAAASPDEIKGAGVTVASLFFRKVYGPTSERILSAFIALSAFGNVMTVTFSQSRLNQELAKEGVLPFPTITASNWPVGSPLAGLIIHLLPSVLVITLPPAGSDAYSLILDTEMWPAQLFAFLVVCGCVWLRVRPDTRDAVRPHRASSLTLVFYLVFDTLLLVFPWIPPPLSRRSDSPGLPYFTAPAIGASITIGLGVLWWLLERTILPSLMDYDLEPHQVVLSDGTKVVEHRKVKRRRGYAALTDES